MKLLLFSVMMAAYAYFSYPWIQYNCYGYEQLYLFTLLFMYCILGHKLIG